MALDRAHAAARLATALHVVLVGLYLTVTLTLAIYVSRRGYGAVAQRSQARRHRQIHVRP
jgi:hypothetical protein